MSIRFQADNDLNVAIVKGVRRWEPAISFQTAQEAAIDGFSDERVLVLAAREDRVLVTHDRKTMPQHFARFLAEGHHSPGVVLISQKAELRRVIEGLILLWAASEPAEWRDRIFELP